ncbi:MAG TPA: polyprenyl synthetase family protein [Thermoanaerobaculia bacterium]|nr:polyprenyl synthetase family protein [Thermoanaerobaculia bacterium]
MVGSRGAAAPHEGAFERYAVTARPGLEAALAQNLPAAARGTGSLAEALEYAVLSPGKRIRPLVAMAAGDLLRARPAGPLAVAVAVEYVHAASLVLDDLPSMDDAERRRGRAALHRVYGVATAELASVTLLARAFETVARESAIPPAARTRILEELAGAVGAAGCCGGQAADLSADPGAVNLEDLEAIHARKTGALFVAAVRGGALAAGAGEGPLEALTIYSRNLGLAFQITDDLLDVEGDPGALGKDAHRDAHRANFATALGAETCRALVAELLETAVAALSSFRGRAAVLVDVARFVRERRS